MARSLAPGRSRKSILPILLLLALLALAVGLWVLSLFIGNPASSADGGAKTDGYSHVTSIYGNGADRLHRPTEVATDRDGNIYVADSFKHRIVVFGQDGRFIRTVGSPANVDGALKYPSSVKVDDSGRIFVTSSEPGKVVIYSPAGKPIKVLEVPEPLTLAIKENRLYIATSRGILIGDLNGEQVGQLLSRGKKPGQIDRPTGMAIGDDGTIYLADSLNYRFQAVDSKGKVKWIIGSQPDAATAVVDKDRAYGLPSGLVLGSDGVLYGIDAFNGEIVAISADGAQLGVFGEWGRQDGQFYYPTGITQVGSERFAVADTFNDRVQIVGIPSPQPDLGINARRGLPWLIPILLGLAVFMLARRPVAVVADAAGIRRAHERGLLPDLLSTTKALYTPLGTADLVAPLIAQDERLIDVLHEVEGFEDEVDPVVKIGAALRGRMGLRRVAIAFPSHEQAEAAQSEGIGVLGETAPMNTAMAVS